MSDLQIFLCPHCMDSGGGECILHNDQCKQCSQVWTDDECPMCAGELAKSHWDDKTHYCRKCARHMTLKPTISQPPQPQENRTTRPQNTMKKLITPAVLTAIGFAFFNEHVREAFTTQPGWLMIVEASIAYIVIGFLTGIDVAAKMAKKKGQSYIDVDPEGILGTVSGIFWPVYWSVAKPIAMIGRVTSAATKKRLTSLRAKRDAKENTA